MKNRINIKDIKVKKEYYDLVPPMKSDDDKVFDESIKNEGIRDPLTLNQNLVLLDGHRRYEKAKKYGYQQLPFSIKDFSDKLEEKRFVIICNLQRRHLTNYQKVELGIPLLEIEKQMAKKRQVEEGKKYGRGKKKTIGSNDPKDTKGKATEVVAKQVGVSNTTMMRGKYVLENLKDEKTIQRLREGRVSINTAYNQLTRKTRNLPKAEMPKGKFDVIYCDIPIAFNDKGGRGKAENHYQTMTDEELTEAEFVRSLPFHNNCIIFFWIPASQLETGFKILYEWEFNYKTHIIWNKDRIGVGSWVRNQHELLLIATKGKMPVPATLYPSVITEKRENHSKKPDIFYSMIESMYPDRKYLELFARKKHNKAWSVYGNEVINQ